MLCVIRATGELIKSANTNEEYARVWGGGEEEEEERGGVPRC